MVWRYFFFPVLALGAGSGMCDGKRLWVETETDVQNKSYRPGKPEPKLQSKRAKQTRQAHEVGGGLD